MMVEFHLFTENNRTLAIVDMPEVPQAGELVKLDGTQYMVRGRGWVIGTTHASGQRTTGATAWVTLKPWTIE